MSVYYEWERETVFSGDTEHHRNRPEIDRDIYDTYEAAVNSIPMEINATSTVALVYDDEDGDSPNSRLWAYVENGILPYRFEESCGRIGPIVPDCYHKEVALIY